ncbi:MAG TPA: WbqC family protein [Thermodesulfobacteriota bacterium]
MIAAVHQPQFMPWLGYLDKIVRSETFAFLDNVQFKKNEFQNRNKIKTAQGWMWLTVPVLYKYPEHIDEVKINDRADWRKKHVRTLAINYQKAPYFHDIFPEVERFYAGDSASIAEVNRESVLMLLGLLGLDRKIVIASALGHLPEEPSERLAAICESLGADTYLSGAGGRAYLDLEPFNKKGITVVFQEFKHPVYPQLYGDFIPNLSLLDLLFNCGPDSLNILEGKLCKA